MRFYKILTPVILVVNFIVALGLLASAYAGTIDPDILSISTVVTMTFPVWIIAAIFMAIIDLLWWRMQTVIPGAAFFICLPMLWNFCPLNISSHKLNEQELARSFTLMSFNVNGFSNQSKVYPDSVNPTVSYILRRDADIVCLQDCYTLGNYPPVQLFQPQIDSLHAVYPYIYHCSRAQAIMSKYPATPLPLDIEFIHELGADMAAYRLNIYGRQLTIFNVHLKSLGLTDEDKELYRDVIKLKGNEKISEVKHQLISKISQAGVIRAHQVQYLLRIIKHYGGENVIVCGDFNDVPGCYALRQLNSEAGLQEVYPEVAFGPSITYNANRLYFRIDHILYRGNLKPVKINRGKIRTSDHYPLTAQFLWDATTGESPSPN